MEEILLQENTTIVQGNNINTEPKEIKKKEKPKEKPLVKEHIILALDFGGSGIKIVYSKKDDTKQSILFMEPYVLEMTEEIKSITQYGSLQENSGDPENRAWIGFDNVYYSVGYLASISLFSIQELATRKYNNAFIYTLAAIWVVKEKLELSDNFDVSIIALLPPGEIEDYSNLYDSLMNNSVNYDTPSGKLNPAIVNYQCLPEGSGVASLHITANLDNIQKQVTSYLMIGYRNASVLNNYKGIVRDGTTSVFGMAYMLNLVIRATSGLTHQDLLKAINNDAGNFSPDNFYCLTESHISDKQRLKEAEKIAAAVKNSHFHYSKSLFKWLREVLPKNVDEIVFCGGTADYLREPLITKFKDVKQSWHGDFLFTPTQESIGMNPRFTDVYGVFSMFFYFVCKSEAIK